MRRVWAVLSTVLVLLVVGGTVAAVYALDGRIRAEAEAQVGASLKQSVPFTVTPQVDITGTPILLNILTKRFPAVRVRGAEMPAALPDGSTLPLLNVDATLRDVTQGDTEIHAESLIGSGRITYADLSRLAGATVSHAGGDRLRVSRPVELFGVKADAALTGVPQVDRQGAITLRDTEVELGQFTLPEQATQALTNRFLQPIAVPLPYGLRVTSAGPGPDGITATVQATDVVFPVR